MLIIIFSIIFVISLGGVMALHFCNNNVGHKHTLKKPNTVKVIQPTKQGKPESKIHDYVMREYGMLPNEHKPSFDIKSSLSALDEKYGITHLNSHFATASRPYSFETSFTSVCPCRRGCLLIWDRVDGQRVTHVHDDSCTKESKTCTSYPEFHAMIAAIEGIQSALDAQRKKQEQREREIVLAGIENDLLAVNDITQALKNERDLIDAMTKEI